MARRSRGDRPAPLTPESLFSDLDGPPSEEEPTEVFDAPETLRAELIVEAGRHAGERVPLGGGTCTIGRSSKCTLTLKKSAGVSRRHAKVFQKDGVYYVEDLESRNGTTLNGEQVVERRPLRDGDIISISQERIRYRGPSALASLEQDRSETERLPEEPSPRPTPRAEARPVEKQPASRPTSPPLPKVKPEDISLEPLDPVEPIPLEDKKPPSLPKLRPPRLPVEEVADPEAAMAMLPGATPASVESAPLLPPEPPPPRPSPLPPDSSPYVFQLKPKRTGRLFLLGGLLGVALALGFVAAWDLTQNEGALAEKVIVELEKLFGEAGATKAKPELSDPPFGDAKGETPPSGDGAKMGASGTDEEPPVDAKGAPPADEKPAEKGPSEHSAAKTPQGEEQNAQVPPATDPVEEEPSAEKPSFTVRSRATGIVTAVRVTVGDRVRTGQKLVIVEPVNAALQRKLTALRREEKMFAEAATAGNERAKRDLDEVRRELRIVEQELRPVAIDTPAGGRVTAVFVKRGDTVRNGLVVAKVAPE